ncbi:hypothetical protein [Schlesneria paludicola]|uniref:hypothetical protein n=1 Tax=Schlesneria paludicola TaxID=360056 RepID=UPI00029AB863|nr:hypothetical protein [Schlesneria paludicola]
MDDLLRLLGMLLIPALLGGSFALSPLIAMKKGYKPWFWLFACGPIGLVTIIFLPPLKSAKDPDEYERLENRADFIGAVLSWIAIFICSIPAAIAVNQAINQSRSIGISE